MEPISAIQSPDVHGELSSVPRIRIQRYRAIGKPGRDTPASGSVTTRKYIPLDLVDVIAARLPRAVRGRNLADQVDIELEADVVCNPDVLADFLVNLEKLSSRRFVQVQRAVIFLSPDSACLSIVPAAASSFTEPDLDGSRLAVGGAGFVGVGLAVIASGPLKGVRATF
jgi:hypothetical protein